MVKPKIRRVNINMARHEGHPVAVVTDPLNLTDQVLILPQPLAILAELCDGSRDIPTLRTALALRTGVLLNEEELEGIISALDEVLLLDNEQFAMAYDAALREFRRASCRTPSLRGKGYPTETVALAQLLESYLNPFSHPSLAEDTALILKPRGLITPHIDYERGGDIYGSVWHEASEAIRGSDLIIILGTDHFGGEHLLTLTRQNYATPWGVIPTAQDIVESLCQVIGEDSAFADELNHRSEHSIELATIWLHYLLQGKSCEMLPLLCGSLHPFIERGDEPGQSEGIAAIIEYLREATASRRTFIVASADLAHMGPAFGGQIPLGFVERAEMAVADRQLMDSICSGDAAGFFSQVKRERNVRNICGLTPIYLTLRLLGKVHGKVTAYAQCPADEANTSLVSICGILLGDA